MDVSLAGSAITYRPDDDQLGSLSLEFAAFDGEVGTGQLPVPDPTAAISVYDGRAVRVEEGATRLTDGFIVDQDRDRGPVPAATARVHTFSVQDANALLDGFRVARTRPSETDVARVLAFAAADGPTWDTDFVLDVETVTMPAKTYDSDGGWTSELIPDVVEFTGKTLFLHDKADGSGRCLHYHNLTSGHGCGLEISDQQRGALASTVYAPIGPRRQRTSVDLRNDVLGRDQAGRTSSATDATSISRHDADGLLHQSLQQFEAVSQADLDVKTAAFLASQKDERDTFTCTIGPLDEDALALIRPGDIITVTSSVMGLTASDQRIAHMTLQPAIGEGGRAAEGYWFAALEMGAPVRRRNRRNVKPLVTETHPPDEPWVCIPADYTLLWDNGTGGGDCIIQPGENACSTANPADSLSPGRVHLYAGATYWVEYETLPLFFPGEVYTGPTGNDLAATLSTTYVAGQAGMHMGTTCGYDNLAAEDPAKWGFWSLEFTAPATDDYFGVLNSTPFFYCSSTYSTLVRIRYVSGHDPRFESLPPCSNGEPAINQQVQYTDVVGDGTTISFTAPWAYVPGSLHVFINGLDWTPEVNETDAAAGEYTLDYPVPVGATSVVEFRRAA